MNFVYFFIYFLFSPNSMHCKTVKLCLISRRHHLAAWPILLIYCINSATAQQCYLKELTKCTSPSGLYDAEILKEACHRNLQATTHTSTVGETNGAVSVKPQTAKCITSEFTYRSHSSTATCRERAVGLICVKKSSKRDANSTESNLKWWKKM